MAKYTKEQLQRMTAPLADGWKLDTHALFIWDRKEVFTDSEENENGIFYRLQLEYKEDYKTGEQVPTATVNRYTPTGSGELYSVVTVYDKEIAERQTKRNFKVLQSLTHTLDIKALFDEAIPHDTGKAYNSPFDFEDDDTAEPEKVGETVAHYDQLKPSLGGIMVDVVAHHDIAKNENGYYIIFAVDSYNSTNNGTSGYFDTFEEAESYLKEVREGSELVNMVAPLANSETAELEKNSIPETTAEPQETAPECAEAIENEEPQPTEGNAEILSGSASFEEMAKAYLTGKTVPTKTKPQETQEEPTEEPTAEPEAKPEPVKQGFGYFGKTSELLSPEELTQVTNGEQVQHHRERTTTAYFATPYNDNTHILYGLDSGYNSPTIKLGYNANYKGFIIDGKLYDNATVKRIDDELADDIDRAIKQAIPSEEDARNSLEEIDERTEAYKGYSFRETAQKHFYDNTTPSLYLYSSCIGFDLSDVASYILNPSEVVNRFSSDYIEGHKAEIYRAYIQYNNTLAELEAIKANPDDETHLLKRIYEAITDEKTVKLTLSNGATVQAEAKGVIGIIHGGYISEWNILAKDRDKLPKNEYNRPDDIHAKDIITITHGQRILYSA